VSARKPARPRKAPRADPVTRPNPAELAKIRERIDQIDAQLQELLNERARFAQRVGISKHGDGHTVDFYRPEREAEVLNRAVERNQGPLRDEEIVRLFREIMSACLAQQEPLKVAFLGPEGTFSRGYLSNAWDLRVDVKIPLYFWRKQRPAAQESVQSLLQAKRQYESTEQTLFSRVKGDYLAAKASRELVDLYSKAIIPQATLALESSMASYEVGRADFLTVVANFLTVLQLEIEYYSEFANYHKAVERLEEMTAQRITG